MAKRTSRAATATIAAPEGGAPAAQPAPAQGSGRRQQRTLGAAERLALIQADENLKLVLCDSFGLLRSFLPNITFEHFLGQATDGTNVTLVRTADSMGAAADQYGLSVAQQVELYLKWIDSLATEPTLPLEEFLLRHLAPQPVAPPVEAPAAAAAPAVAPAPAPAVLEPYVILLNIAVAEAQQCQQHLDRRTPVAEDKSGVYWTRGLNLSDRIGAYVELIMDTTGTYISACLTDSSTNPPAVLAEGEPRHTLLGDYAFQSPQIYDNRPFILRVTAS